MTVQFVGSGDAFGSGGRFQACISVRAGSSHILLDCGASSLIAMRRLGLNPSSVQAVIVTHLHGDHFGGIPFLVLDAQFGRRQQPLVLAGPPGTRERMLQAMEVFFPGSSRTQREFELRFMELPARKEVTIGDLVATAYEVSHASGAQAYALRLAGGGKVLTYSGDTEWTESLVEASDGADLFVCESYFFEKPIRNHLDYATLRRHRAQLRCSRLLLTHPSADLLARRAELDAELADDGFVLSV